jgi:hypothetical protein
MRMFCFVPAGVKVAVEIVGVSVVADCAAV